LAKICANCKATQGPFQSNWSDWNIPICKRTKSSPDRILECVARRDKIDTDRYKELLHPYAAE